MRIGGQGDQEVTYNHNYRLASKVVGERNVHVQPTGVYRGFDLTVEDDNKVRVHPGTLEIRDERGASFPHQIRSKINVEFVIDSVTESMPYVVARWEFEEVTDDDGDADNYVGFESSSYPSNEYWVILGKGEFDGNGHLTSVDTSIRDFPRSETIEAFDFVVLSQKDLHHAIEDPNITSIYVKNDNAPYTLYHTRENRFLDPAGNMKIIGDGFNNPDYDDPHLTTPNGTTGDLLNLDDGQSLRFDSVNFDINNGSSLVTVDSSTATVDFINCHIRGTSTSSSSAILTVLNSLTFGFVENCRFEEWPTEPVINVGNIGRWKFDNNTSLNLQGSWDTDIDLRIVNGSRSDAHTVDGHPVTRASTFDQASDNELIPRGKINEKIDASAQGFEKSVETVNDLPDMATANDPNSDLELEPNDLYEVVSDSNTGPGYVQAQSDGVPYPGGAWVIVDTDDDGDMEEWQLFSKTLAGESGSGLDHVSVAPSKEDQYYQATADGGYSTVELKFDESNGELAIASTARSGQSRTIGLTLSVYGADINSVTDNTSGNDSYNFSGNEVQINFDTSTELDEYVLNLSNHSPDTFIELDVNSVNTGSSPAIDLITYGNEVYERNITLEHVSQNDVIKRFPLRPLENFARTDQNETFEQDVTVLGHIFQNAIGPGSSTVFESDDSNNEFMAVSEDGTIKWNWNYLGGDAGEGLLLADENGNIYQIEQDGPFIHYTVVDMKDNTIKGIDTLKFFDANDDDQEWGAGEDDSTGHFDFTHPALSRIRFLQSGQIETDGLDGDPGADDRLAPRGYVRDKSWGIKGKSNTVDGLPLMSQIDEDVGTAYVVRDGVYSTSRNDVQAESNGISYPPGIWVARDTGGSEEADEWQLLIETNWSTFTSGTVDYYVDINNGDNTNDGSQSSPFKTLERAVDEVPEMVDGTVTIHIEDGTYDLSQVDLNQFEGMGLNRFEGVGTGRIDFIGNDPGNTVLDAGGNTILVENTTPMTFRNMTFDNYGDPAFRVFDQPKFELVGDIEMANYSSSVFMRLLKSEFVGLRRGINFLSPSVGSVNLEIEDSDLILDDSQRTEINTQDSADVTFNLYDKSSLQTVWAGSSTELHLNSTGVDFIFNLYQNSYIHNQNDITEA